MRPLNIKISGFGSYCNFTEIDLQKLGEKGLYLITGDTGAGKTTIFDAIVFALYGAASGPNRDKSMLRSTFADADQPTEVELTFLLKDKIYKVKRNPSYLRKAKKGDGFTTQTAEAVLTMPDGSVITKDGAVTAEITRLLGIDKDQFCQIVMIAQGDFQKILIESTEKRKEIFRKLFKTHKFENLQQKLKEEDSMYTHKLSELMLLADSSFKNAVCNEESVLSIELKKVHETQISAEDKIEIIGKVIDEDSQKKLLLENQVEELQKKLDDLTVQITKAETYDKTRKSLEQKKEDLIKLEQIYIKAEEELNTQKQSESEIGELEQKAAVIENLFGKYDLVETKQKQINLLEKEILNNKKLSAEIEEKLNSCQNKIEKAESEIKDFGNLEEQLYKITSLVDGITDKKTALEKNQSELEDLCSEYESLGKLQTEYTKAFSDYKELNETFIKMNEAYFNEQAGIIAETLEENKPCPVCGSTHHPKLAEKSLEAPTKLQLDDFQKKVETAKEKYINKSEKASSVKGSFENKKVNLLEEINKELKTSYTFEADFNKECKNVKEKLVVLIESIKENYAENKKQLSEIEENISKKKELEFQLPQFKDLLENNKKTKSQLEIKAASDNSKLESENENLLVLKNELPYGSKAEAETELKKITQKADFLKQALEKSQKSFDECKINISRTKGEITSLEESLNSQDKVDVLVLQSKKTEFEEEKTAVNNKLKEIYNRITINENIIKAVKEISEQLIPLQKKQAYVSALYKTASGRIGGEKGKIMLETYIQTTYFDRIIAFANNRFLIMSDNQYELKRDETVDNKSQSGLELNVIDHYNGTSRSVKTLSGGESFEASLSLALGLSDEISHSAGGIKIDTMFVDEGFGSLDSDTLQKAYSALSNITEGNKLVGIISHVDLLKDKIDKQVVVTKTPEKGSSVTIKV